MPYKDICIEEIKAIALGAGEIIMKIYAQEFEVDYKKDNSPLTLADTKSNEYICTALKKAFPDIPIMSEENKQTDYEIRKNWECYWCVDPIDGTKEFVKKTGEFTVNIALIFQNEPVLGVVYAPAIGELYYAKKNEGAFKTLLDKNKQAIETNQLPIRHNTHLEEEIVVVASVSHLSQETQDFIDTLAKKTKGLTTSSKGSSLKLCMIASGQADVYPRLAPTMEWDTAAADAVVREAGKCSYIYTDSFDFFDLKKQTPLKYNKQDLLNPWFVVC
jgi:3'(2'), 5'-bisphosphate nucleotidase